MRSTPVSLKDTLSDQKGVSWWSRNNCLHHVAPIGGILRSAFWNSLHVSPSRMLTQRLPVLCLKPGLGETKPGEIVARDICTCLDKSESAIVSINVHINAASDLGGLFLYSSL